MTLTKKLACDRSPTTPPVAPKTTSQRRGGSAAVRETIGIMHLTDTLDAGGRERIAVNMLNSMPRDRYRTFVCTTRRDGPLLAMLSDDVGRLSLNRRRTLDLSAIVRLARYIRQNKISLVHAHGTSLVVAYLVSLMVRDLVIVWHDHFGTNDRRERAVSLYRLMTRRVAAVLAVSQPLADWSRRRLRFPGERIWCLPNFVPEIRDDLEPPDLPGMAGHRVICVANLRPVKNQLMLLDAMQIVLANQPETHLMLVGERNDADYAAAIERKIANLGLADSVTVLGPRSDVPNVLRGCDVGVLSSMSEGLPVSLLEYGAAGLAVVVTDVGQCGKVLDGGAVGKLVPPGSPKELAATIAALLQDPKERSQLGDAFRTRVARHYSAEAVIGELDSIYRTVLQR